MSAAANISRTGKVRRVATVVLTGMLFTEVALLYVMHERSLNGGSDNEVSPMETLGLDQVSPISHPPISAFNEVTRRPLFELDRRQIVVPTTRSGNGGSKTKFSNDWRLTGLVIGEDRSVAILENSRTAEVMSLATGDSHDGWAIENVASNRVVIRNGASRQEFILDKSARPDTSIAERNGVLVRKN